MRFGLIFRIALLVMGVEVAAFGTLEWFYTNRFSHLAEERLLSRMALVERMIANSELAVSGIANVGMMSNLLGVAYVDGMVIGGSGRVIASSDPAYLGRRAETVPGVDPAWLKDDAPETRIVASRDMLTSIGRLRGEAQASPVYSTILTVSTRELNEQKQAVAWRGRMASALFILLTSAGIIAMAYALITRRVRHSLEVLKRVEGGQLGERISVTADDELGRLQNGINSMTEKLAQLLDEHCRNEKEISTILDAITDGVIAIGPDGGVLRSNPSAARILVGRAETPLAGNIDALLPELTRPDDPFWWCAEESLTAERRLHFERAGADAMPRFIEVGHGPIRDPDGSLIGAVFVLQDATARKKVEQELRDAVERLTVSNSELERFAYVASHDLQEPLRTIISFTQLLDRQLDDKLSAEDREQFGFVVAAAKRMKLLISDLLTYSRVNSRGIHFAPVSLQQACTSALDNLRETIQESHAEVVVQTLPGVTGDSIQLMQVFQNLIGNAIKFRRPDATPRVEVSAVRRPGEWIVSVADNGIGIPETQQDIFEIFRRLHSNRSFPGTGVGLAICKRIIQRHNGRIWFDSRPGQGTTFHFALPVEE